MSSIICLQPIPGDQVGRVYEQSVNPLALGGEEQLPADLQLIGNAGSVIPIQIRPQTISGSIIGTEIDQRHRRGAPTRGLKGVKGALVCGQFRLGLTDACHPHRRGANLT